MSFIIKLIDRLQRGGVNLNHRYVLYVKNTGKPFEYYSHLIVKAYTSRKSGY